MKTARRITASLLGLYAGLLGAAHGYFEIRQGSVAPDGLMISAIGPPCQPKLATHACFPAMTLIPNFLLTGIVAMSVSVAIVAWAIHRLPSRRGVLVMLGLFILLTLSGGGLGFVPFYLITCAYATRIDSPLSWSRRVLAAGGRSAMARVWPYALACAGFCWMMAIELAIFGWLPGVSDPDIILAVCWSLLLATLVLINVAYVSAFAADAARVGVDFGYPSGG